MEVTGATVLMMNEIELMKKLRGLSEPSPSIEVDVPDDLVFDDEPIESVLYGHQSSPPTPSSIFQPAREILIRLRSTSTDTKSEEALQTYIRFLNDGYPVSKELFVSLTSTASSLLPVWPKPLSPDMPHSVGRLMECLWRHANEKGDDELKSIAGIRLWEWYEYTKHYADARIVLLALEDIYRDRYEQTSIPAIINNLAFQFQKECMWKEAIVHFDRAACLANELGLKPDFANSRANYWGCRFELEGIDICGLMVPELRRLGAVLREAKWKAGERKVLVLLARAEATLGNHQVGIPLLEQAIALDVSQNSMYLEQDQKLLRDLQNHSV